jgi:4-hydroxyphenylpyruvate dioxygenase
MSATDSFLIHGIDHLHLLVGNALQASYFYRAALGFSLTGYRGPETGTRDHVSYVLQQGRIRLVLSSPLTADNPMQEHIRRHGDGVRDVAFAVDNPVAAWKAAVERGAEPAYEPSAMEDSGGIFRMAGVAAFGDTIHSFVGRKDYTGAFRPGFCAIKEEDKLARPAGLLHIDCLVAHVGSGEIARWAGLYEKALGFSRSDSPGGNAHRTRLSKPAGDGGQVQLVLEQQESSEFLDAYQGPGVSSIAVAVTDSFDTVARLRAQGVEFPQPPVASAGNFRTSTKPLSDRPTLRFEITAV